MPGEPIYASRILKLPVLVPGDAIGRVDDLVVGPPMGGTAPVLLGLVAQVGHRRVFISGSRVAHFEASGAVLTSSAIDLRPFKARVGELLVTSILGRLLGSDKVLDLSLRPRSQLYGRFGIDEVVLSPRRALGFSARTRRVPWAQAAELFDVGEAAAEIVKLRGLHPSETARAFQDLPDLRRGELVEALPDEDLANILEELPELDQAEILGTLDHERAARVLEEMEPDDAAD
ncbi:MAG: magnesium transporter MgtE N-terminal domain-containing protein, partial [Acidimicrobiia bacterium]